MRTQVLSVALALVAVSPLAAQRNAPRTRTPAVADSAAIRAAVATITEADYRRRISILADDSMRGRATPSPELEEVATWIAGEFRRFGLRPGGDSGTFLQRYPIRRTQLDAEQTFASVAGRGVTGRWQAGRDAQLLGTLGGEMPAAPVSGPIVLVAGTADSARPFGDAPRGSVALVLPRVGTQGIQLIAGKAQGAGISAVIMLSSQSAEAFANAARQAASQSRLELYTGAAAGAPGVPFFIVRDSSMLDILRAAGEDMGQIRAGQNNGARMLAGFTGSAAAHSNVLSETSAPNVIGILEGSDPQLKNEYVFFSGHMDHVGVAGGGQGCRAVGADSICNGADDDASGTTAVVMLAQAFSQLNPRPRRSMVFMTVSGEERGLWGSEYYSEHPTLPIGQTVADINTDMIGRYFDNRPGWRDTISVIGKEHSSLGLVADRVTRSHPELHMQLVDDMWPSENFYGRSDHFNFARKGVPILFFFNGTHPDYHRVTDSVDKIDAEKAARITQMVFYVGLEVANTTDRPQWDPASRQRIVEPATP